MALRGLPREKVLATVVYLLDTTLIRIGNDDYARQNKSYGLTTLQNRHVNVEGTEVRFRFVGKSGKPWFARIRNRRVAKIIRACQELPGQELLQYLDDDGVPRDVTSSDVNAYLREVTGADITAKDFRTWAGTVLCAVALNEMERLYRISRRRKEISAAQSPALRLGSAIRRPFVENAMCIPLSRRRILRERLVLDIDGPPQSLGWPGARYAGTGRGGRNGVLRAYLRADREAKRDSVARPPFVVLRR